MSTTMLKTIVARFQTVMRSSLSQQSAVDMVNYWRSRPAKLLYGAGSPEINRYFQAVVRLQQLPNTKGTDELIATAMARLKREFVVVLKQENDQAGQASTTEWSSIVDSTANVFRYVEYSLPKLPSDDVISYLRNIAERMNSNGRIRECVKDYVSVRKTFLQAQLNELKFKEVTGGCNRARCEGDDLKVKMQLWGELAKICVKKLFQREKEICDQIFEGIGENNAAKDECLVGTVNEFAQELFGFVEDMTMSSLSYDKMETVLAMYSAFLELLPDADTLFHSAAGNGIRNTCTETLSRIESELGRMLSEFEQDVLNEDDQSDVVDGRGAVDPLTQYVMKQINFIVEKRVLLTKFINSAPSLNFGDVTIPQEDLGDVSNCTPIQRHLILIIVLLQKNLQTKSLKFPDFSSGQLFKMNNLHYIVQKVEASPELQEMIGDAYLNNKLKGNLSSAVTNYQKWTCGKFLRCFDDEGLYITRWFRSRPSKTAFRNRMIAFNSVCRETQSLHSTWTILEPLREGIYNSMSLELVPKYRKFLEMFTSNPDIARIRTEELRYSAEEFEALILRKLFAPTQVEY